MQLEIYIRLSKRLLIPIAKAPHLLSAASAWAMLVSVADRITGCSCQPESQ